MNPTDQPMLDLEQVDAGYGPIRILHRISMVVRRGEVVALIGANGAGKSTLMNAIFGVPRAYHGRIRFEGRDLLPLATFRIARLGIALVPEGRRIFSGMSVAENLAMGAMGAGTTGALPDPEILARVQELFPILAERHRQRAGTLSGGEQQMLAIGRALMSRPRLLLLDEPSLGLAPLVIQRIFATLREIVAGGTTVFLVEQNANLALRLADRGYVMVNGEIRLAGTGQELLANPEIRRAYLGGI